MKERVKNMNKLIIEKGTVTTMKEPNSVLYYDKKENRAWARSFYNRDDSIRYHDENIITITFLPDDFLAGAEWSRKLIKESIEFHMAYVEATK